MNGNETQQWHWQEPGTAWRGIGVYHVTLTVPSRQPLFGTLVIPQNDPSQARVERTPLGNAVIDELYVMCRHYPAVRVLQFCLMPDHLHAVIQVTKVMETSIRSVIRGYWQGVKKLGRAYTLAASGGASATLGPSASSSASLSVSPAPSAVLPAPSSVSPEFNSGPTDKGGTGPTDKAGAAYTFPIFTERPFIRPLSRRGQLQAMIRYVQMNPQRLATKRLMPGFFRVQKGIEVAGRNYDGVGNVTLLHARHFGVVHVRSVMVKTAEHGDSQPLRDYMNGCVLAARHGSVMVSPFISPDEKRVMNVLLKEQHPFILLTDNGFRGYYKPADALYDAVAAGRVLILSPWAYDSAKRHISRADCIALNAMAEEITIAGIESRN